jgi:hypothetical protein
VHFIEAAGHDDIAGRRAVRRAGEPLPDDGAERWLGLVQALLDRLAEPGA